MSVRVRAGAGALLGWTGSFPAGVLGQPLWCPDGVSDSCGSPRRVGVEPHSLCLSVTGRTVAAGASMSARVQGGEPWPAEAGSGCGAGGPCRRTRERAQVRTRRRRAQIICRFGFDSIATAAGEPAECPASVAHRSPSL
jgi:hypothetical protein